jgi:hypothetical protein
MSPIPELLSAEMFTGAASRQFEHAVDTMKQIKNTDFSVEPVPYNRVVLDPYDIGCSMAILLERDVVRDMLAHGNTWTPILNHFHNLILDPEALKQLKTIFGIRVHLPGGKWHDVTITNSEGVTIRLNTPDKSAPYTPWEDEAQIIANLALIPNNLWHFVQQNGLIVGAITGNVHEIPWKASFLSGALLPDRTGVFTEHTRKAMHYPIDIHGMLQTNPAFLNISRPLGIFIDKRNEKA